MFVCWAGKLKKQFLPCVGLADFVLLLLRFASFLGSRLLLQIDADQGSISFVRHYPTTLEIFGISHHAPSPLTHLHNLVLTYLRIFRLTLEFRLDPFKVTDDSIGLQFQRPFAAWYGSSRHKSFWPAVPQYSGLCDREYFCHLIFRTSRLNPSRCPHSGGMS